MTKAVEALKVLSAEMYSTRPSYVWQCIMRELRGPEGLAREVAQAIEDSEPGSANRVRILVAVLTGLMKLDGTEDDGEDDLGKLKGRLAEFVATNPELLSAESP